MPLSAAPHARLAAHAIARSPAHLLVRLRPRFAMPRRGLGRLGLLSLYRLHARPHKAVTLSRSRVTGFTIGSEPARRPSLQMGLEAAGGAAHPAHAAELAHEAPPRLAAAAFLYGHHLLHHLLGVFELREQLV